jgi:hypothetical protein
MLESLPTTLRIDKLLKILDDSCQLITLKTLCTINPCCIMSGFNKIGFTNQKPSPLQVSFGSHQLLVIEARAATKPSCQARRNREGWFNQNHCTCIKYKQYNNCVINSTHRINADILE